MSISQQIMGRISGDAVVIAADFVDLGSRAAVNKALQRLVGSGVLRRIDRGLYDLVRQNSLTRHRQFQTL